jgi:hypothetical protein
MASEFYSISADVISGSVDVSTLRQEIIDNAIVQDSDYIIVRGDSIEIAFPTTINSTEKTALDTIVSAHPVLNTENPDSASTSIKSLVDPTVNNDSSEYILIGDTWTNTSTNETFVCVDNSVGSAIWKSSTSGSIQNYEHLFDSAGRLVYITRPPNRSEILTI